MDKTFNFCDEEVQSGNTRLQLAAKEEVARLIALVEERTTMHAFKNEINVHKWMFTVCEHLRSILGVMLSAKDLLAGYDDLKIKNFDSQVKTALKKLKDTLQASFEGIKCESEMPFWEDMHVYFRNLIGCTEQCPFCGEQCDLSGPDHLVHVNHYVSAHRPVCLQGLHSQPTKTLTMSSCSICVTGLTEDKTFMTAATGNTPVLYKDYRRIYPHWSITPDLACKQLLYWKLFLAKYNDKIAQRFNLRPAPVPLDWLHLTWEDVSSDLKAHYYI